jgi:thioredoxin-related protein
MEIIVISVPCENRYNSRFQINCLSKKMFRMKRVLFAVLAVMLCAQTLEAGEKNKKGKASGAAEAAKPDDSTEIHWMTLDEVQVAMKKQPRKVFFDVYTDWCGWCKVMDKKTFSNKEVIKYMNKNFYAVKLNAERQDSVMFMGKLYGFVPGYRANQLAVDLLGGRMSYPTSVILEENFQNPAPIPGYLDVTMMEKILKYLGENIYKSKQFPDYEKEFVASWSTDAANTGTR